MALGGSNGPCSYTVYVVQCWDAHGSQWLNIVWLLHSRMYPEHVSETLIIQHNAHVFKMLTYAYIHFTKYYSFYFLYTAYICTVIVQVIC